MLAVVIISFALYPLLFDFVMKRSKKKDSHRFPSAILINSIISLIYYALGGFLFSFLGSFFIKKAKGKTLENSKKIVAKFLTSVLYSNPFVRKTLIKNPNENFQNPAVIIANHSSFLDTLAMAMATHKIVYLVNDWVYNSPIFGKIVKAMGFYPVSQGIENGIDVLQEKINQGYSLVVFPEAERSMSNRIQRFHKGAFYLAEKYNLDILPIFIHGNAEVMPKNDFMIHDGRITVKVGDRISKNDPNFGKNYSERTKKIQNYFRAEFAKLRNELEDENYFRHALFNSFLYKEKEVLDEIKKDFELNKSDYHTLNQWIKADEKILHIGNDLGQTDVLLALNEAGRKITSFIINENHRDIARQNYVAKRRSILYPNEIPADKNFETIVLSDVRFLELIKFYNSEKIILFNIAEPVEIPGYTQVLTQGKLRLFKQNF